jgi:DNA-binding NarL/FixJ family response regulator
VLSRLEQTVTREDYPLRMAAYQGSDITNELANLSVPTLVLHPRHLVILPAEESMRVAARVAGARFVLIEGEVTPGDAETGLAAIDSFIEAQDLKPKVETAEGVLSTREAEVLRLMAEGRSNAQIAEALVISPNTVGRHVSNIFDKIGAANRTEAAAYAHQHGIG